jgi:hypothetical protein
MEGPLSLCLGVSVLFTEVAGYDAQNEIATDFVFRYMYEVPVEIHAAYQYRHVYQVG